MEEQIIKELNAVLSSQKVELSITDDIKKLMSQALNNKNIYNGDAEKAIAAIKKAKLTATDWRSNLQDAQKKIIELDTAAKSLGIEVPKEILEYKNVVKKGIDDVSKSITTLNGLQMGVPLI
jgi:hypothetical protein